MFLSTKERASKSLRRLTKTKISTPIAQINTLELPKKIIKALYDYEAKAPHEISFKKGDFFHVTGRENDLDWFEACNPASNLKGIVPVSYFQVIDKTERSLTVNRPTSSSTSSTLTSELDSGFSDMSIHGQNLNKSKHQIYGVVMYDFKAERPDELNAQAGEAIVVIAQSNHEWFVAKPIGRLGGPGLIPVSFVQVRNAQTGERIDDKSQNVTTYIPGVDDWKKMTQSYEASSIPLGVFEKKKSITPAPVTAAGTASNLARVSDGSMTNDLVTFASIDSYILEGDQYWFVIYARVNQNCHRILYRLYEDFYDFQINLLQAYPTEAGKEERERILPYMPGPLTYVDETVTSERQADLNEYCKDLLNLPKYLSNCDLVQKQLFGIHEGDIELDYDPRVSNQSNINNTRSNVNSAHSNTNSNRSNVNSIHSNANSNHNNYDHSVNSNYMNRTSSTLSTSPLPNMVAAVPLLSPCSLSRPPSQPQQSQQQIKIKIIHKEDMFAMKVPVNCSLDYLRAKIHERIGQDIKMEYKSEASGQNEPLEEELDMEEAFVQAIQRGKLTVTAIVMD